MIANNADTEGLFHAVWAESGAVLPLGWIDQPAAQQSYDTFVSRVNCSGVLDTLACLRAAPVDAVNAAGALDGSWHPSADGSFIRGLPQPALVRGKIAKMPVVAGKSIL